VAEIEKRKRARGRGARRTKDLGLQKHGRYLKGIDQGPIGRRIGAKVKEGREAAGLSIEALAKHVGGTPKWLEAVESGKTLPSQEAAYRLVKAIWNKTTWRDKPHMRGIGEKLDVGYQVRISVYDKAFLAEWQQFAAATGSTLSTIARYAMERLFADGPTLVTIKEGVAVAEKMRALSLLEAYPEYVQLLRGDPLAAQLVHQAPEVNWTSIAERDGYRLGSDVILAGGRDASEDVTTTGPA
jgi:transcriptional regulator with XRE-family HTH domain